MKNILTWALIVAMLCTTVGLVVAYLVKTENRENTCPECGAYLITERYTHDDLTYIDKMCVDCTYSSTYTYVE